jgi:hypothetical protein
VPTLVYADGSAQTNPSVMQVKEKLASLAPRLLTAPVNSARAHSARLTQHGAEVTTTPAAERRTSPRPATC